MKITITGWQKGCNTIKIIKALREETKCSLHDALVIVNRMLDGEKVVVEGISSDLFIESLNDLGVMTDA